MKVKNPILTGRLTDALVPEFVPDTQITEKDVEYENTSELQADMFSVISSNGGTAVDQNGLAMYVAGQLGLTVTKEKLVQLMSTLSDGNAIFIRTPDFQRWWRTTSSSLDLDVNDIAVQFRRGVRAQAVLRAARNAVVSGWSEHTAVLRVVRELFHYCRMDAPFDATAMTSLATDLQLDYSADMISEIVAGIDKTGNGCVEFHEFEVWWTSKGGDDAAAAAAHTQFRSMLRLCGVMSAPNTGRNLQQALQSARIVMSDPALAARIESALDELVQYSQGQKRLDDALGGQDAGDLISPEELIGKSLGFLTADNPVRRQLHRMVIHRAFENFILLCIFVNILALAVVTPGSDSQILGGINVFVGITFTLEMVCRILVRGFYSGSDSFFKRPGCGWNIFDLGVITIMWAGYVAVATGLVDSKFSLAMSILRSFHGIRFLSGSRQIIESIGHGSSTLWLVLELMTGLFVVFAIVGREILGGALSRQCIDAESTSSAEVVCPLTFTCATCTAISPLSGDISRLQHIDKMGFDQLLQSFLTIFSIMALDDWPLVATVFRRLDLSTSVLVWPYFVIVVSMLSFVTVNLLIATVTFSYMAIRQQEHLEVGMLKAHGLLLAALAGKLETDDDDTSRIGSNEKPIDMDSWSSKIVHSANFDHFIVGIVSANVMCMAVEHHGMPTVMTTILMALDVVFTGIYIFEACVKLHALGLKAYFKSGLNILDFSIVVTGLIGYIFELVVAVGGAVGSNSQVFRLVRLVRLLRAARAMRIGKIIFHQPAITNILSIAFASWTAILSLTFLMLFTLFITAIMAMHMFSSCDVHSRLNYDSLWRALVANFNVMTADNFATYMYEYMDCAGGGVAVYFVILFILVDYVMLYLYLAIFIEGFSLSDEEKRQKQVEVYVDRMRSKDGVIDLSDMKGLSTLVDIMYKGSSLLQRLPRLVAGPSETKESNREYEENFERLSSCGCIGVDNPVRKVAINIVESPVFQQMIALGIAFSGVCIALEGHEGSEVTPVVITLLAVADIAFFVLFAFECMLTVLAKGFVVGPDAYLSRTSHCFDFFVVVVTSIEMLLRILQVNARWMTFVRLLRILRVLRLLERIKSMSVMAEAIADSLPSVAAIAGLTFGSFLMFGIISMQLFSGTLWYCQENIALDKAGCEELGNTWQNHYFHFDNIFASLGTLFIIMTKQGWTDIYLTCTDATQIDEAPQTDRNAVFAAPFFLIFIMVNSFMLEQLFVGVLVDHFAQSSGHALMTAEQKNWRYVHMCLYRFRATEKAPPVTPWRRQCYDLVSDTKFRRFILGCIVANIGALILNSAIFPVRDSPAFDYVEDLCILIYSLEFVLKVAAFGWMTYATENKLDAAVLCTMWVTGIHAHLLHQGLYDGLIWLQALQCVRVLRLFDAMAESRRLAKLVQTVMLSMPHVANLFTLMSLNFFIFGVAAMKFWGNMPLDNPDLEVIDEYNNFGNVFNSMALLVQITTGTALPPIVKDCGRFAGGSGGIILFLSLFFLISNFLFLNLFIALVLENFEYNWSVCSCGWQLPRVHSANRSPIFSGTLLRSRLQV
jgi:voltage-dependent calcium channel L type alpha-1D